MQIDAPALILELDARAYFEREFDVPVGSAFAHKLHFVYLYLCGVFFVDYVQVSKKILLVLLQRYVFLILSVAKSAHNTGGVARLAMKLGLLQHTFSSIWRTDIRFVLGPLWRKLSGISSFGRSLMWQLICRVLKSLPPPSALSA